jgi:arylsulfatase A-like enzyme
MVQVQFQSPSTPLNDRSDVPSIAFPGPPITKTNDGWKKTIHAYDAEVAQMDAQLGLILDEMDRQHSHTSIPLHFLAN